jgi:hypothetical protein
MNLKGLQPVLKVIYMRICFEGFRKPWVRTLFYVEI